MVAVEKCSLSHGCHCRCPLHRRPLHRRNTTWNETLALVIEWQSVDVHIKCRLPCVHYLNVTIGNIAPEACTNNIEIWRSVLLITIHSKLNCHKVNWPIMPPLNDWVNISMPTDFTTNSIFVVYIYGCVVLCCVVYDTWNAVAILLADTCTKIDCI